MKNRVLSLPLYLPGEVRGLKYLRGQGGKTAFGATKQNADLVMQMECAPMGLNQFCLKKISFMNVLKCVCALIF